MPPVRDGTGCCARNTTRPGRPGPALLAMSPGQARRATPKEDSSFQMESRPDEGHARLSKYPELRLSARDSRYVPGKRPDQMRKTRSQCRARIADRPAGALARGTIQLNPT